MSYHGLGLSIGIPTSLGPLSTTSTTTPPANTSPFTLQPAFLSQPKYEPALVQQSIVPVAPLAPTSSQIQTALPTSSTYQVVPSVPTTNVLPIKPGSLPLPIPGTRDAVQTVAAISAVVTASRIGLPDVRPALTQTEVSAFQPTATIQPAEVTTRYEPTLDNQGIVATTAVSIPFTPTVEYMQIPSTAATDAKAQAMLAEMQRQQAIYAAQTKALQDQIAMLNQQTMSLYQQEQVRQLEARKKALEDQARLDLENAFKEPVIAEPVAAPKDNKILYVGLAAAGIAALLMLRGQ
jgi:hypothetical protein